MRRVRDQGIKRTQGPRDQRTKEPEDQGTRGPGTRGPGDQRIRLFFQQIYMCFQCLRFFSRKLRFFSIIIPSSKLIGKDDKATTSPSTTLLSHSSLKDLKQAQADPCCTSTITMNDLVQHHSRKHQLRPQWATDPKYGSIWQF